MQASPSPASCRRFRIIVYGVSIDEVREALAECQCDDDIPKNAMAAAPPPTRESADARESARADAHSIDEYAATVYSRIPCTFIDAATHPKTTNLLCWHCALAFGTAPRFIATERISASSREWNIFGNFCSWACAAAYIDESSALPRVSAIQRSCVRSRDELIQNLAIVRAQYDNNRAPIRAIAPAPPRTSMRAYCGDRGMSQDEYMRIVAQLSDNPPSPPR